MAETYLRLEEISIKNLKNVVNGIINFSNGMTLDEFGEKSSVTAIYGQNGSGKTSVAVAIDLVKLIFLGNPLWDDIFDCINCDADSCDLTFSFINYAGGSPISKIVYTFSLGKNYENPFFSSFLSEKLSVSYFDSYNWTRLNSIFEYNHKNFETGTFSPESKYILTTNNDTNKKINIGVAFRMSQRARTSFLFSTEFFNEIENSKNQELVDIILLLHDYACNSLFIVKNGLFGLINSNDFLPISLKLNEKLGIKDLMVSQQLPSVVYDVDYPRLEKIIRNLGDVMNALVPSVLIKTKMVSKLTLPDGKNGIQFELVSERGGKEIPIRYESEGIKKIFSVIYLLVEMYNNSSFCVVIDELDSGIFEHLLGELLKIIQENGCGQLIFTSHNLRPLEIIDKGAVVCTTANPNNRYIRLKYLKPTNNLRDCYIRALNLGGQDEELAIQADAAKIRRAFRKVKTNGEN